MAKKTTGTAAAGKPSEFEIKYDSSIEQLAVSRLTNMYSNPLAAAIRETISNALDAVKRAGNAEVAAHGGVEVSIVEDEACGGASPSHRLVVKDSGLGMSQSEVEHTFLQYGSSSKSKDGKTIGSFGLGAKSPLAYGKSFEVWSDDGSACTHAVASRDEFGKLGAWLEKAERREEGRGTTITFPLDDREPLGGDFEADRILRLFDATRLALGKPPVWTVTQEAIARNENIASFAIESGELFVLDQENVETVRLLNAGAFIADVLFSPSTPQFLDPSTRENFNVFVEIEGWLYPVNGGVWDVWKSRTTPMAVVTLKDTSKISFTPSRDALSCDLSHLVPAVASALLGLRGLSDGKKLEAVVKASSSRGISEAVAVFKAMEKTAVSIRTKKNVSRATLDLSQDFDLLRLAMMELEEGAAKWDELTSGPNALFCIGSNRHPHIGEKVLVRYDTKARRALPLSPVSPFFPLLKSNAQLKSALAAATLSEPFVDLNEKTVAACCKGYDWASVSLREHGTQTIERVEALSPIRLGVAQALCEIGKDRAMGTRPDVVLIDASKVGARKACSALKRLDASLFPFDNEKSGVNIIHIIIPAKDKKKSDATAEVAKITDVVKQECADNLLKLTVISAVELNDFIAPQKGGAAGAKNEEETGDKVARAIDIKKLPGRFIQIRDGKEIQAAIDAGEAEAAARFTKAKFDLIRNLSVRLPEDIDVDDLATNPTDYAIFNFGEAARLETSMAIACNILFTVDYTPWATKKLLITSAMTKKTLLQLEKAGATVVFDGSMTAANPVLRDPEYVNYIKSPEGAQAWGSPWLVPCGILLPKGVDDSADRVVELAISIVNGLSVKENCRESEMGWQVLFFDEGVEGAESLLNKAPRDISGGVLIPQIKNAIQLISQFRFRFNSDNLNRSLEPGNPVLGVGKEGGALHFVLDTEKVDPEISEKREAYEAWKKTGEILGVALTPPETRLDGKTLARLKAFAAFLNGNQLFQSLKFGIESGVSVDDLLGML